MKTIKTNHNGKPRRAARPITEKIIKPSASLLRSWTRVPSNAELDALLTHARSTVAKNLFIKSIEVTKEIDGRLVTGFLYQVVLHLLEKDSNKCVSYPPCDAEHLKLYFGKFIFKEDEQE